jgi:hypothetical protein
MFILLSIFSYKKSMKNLLPLLFLFCVSILFSGCPYTSDVPVDVPNIKFESKYSGIWHEAQSPNVKYEIKKFNEFEYLITQIPDTGSKNVKDDNLDVSVEVTKSSDSTIYTGHISKINEFYFLNLKSKGQSFFQSNQYSIYKIDFISNSEFRLTEITSNIKEQFDNSNDLRNYIEKYMDAGISFFYGAETTYINKK